MVVRNFYGLKRPAAEEEYESNHTTTDLVTNGGKTTASATSTGSLSSTKACQVPTSTSPACPTPLSSSSTRHAKKARLFVPEPVYEKFSRQKKAIDFAHNSYQSVTIFAFESEEFGSDGQRRYIATTYYEFGNRYLKMAPVDRHHYEVIVEGAACRLYFDIEFMREFNPAVDQIFLLDTFIEGSDSLLVLIWQYVCYQLHAMYNVTCDRTNIVDLDSTTPQKFSRHLIFHMPSAIFRNNIFVGEFVKGICGQLRHFKCHVESGMEIEEAHELVYSTSRRSKRDRPCPPGERLLQLFVNNRQGQKVLICDEAVYTRNRNFRLYLSRKLGKSAAVLRVAKESTFRSSYSESTTKREWSRRFNTLMDSLVCNVSFQTAQHIRILPTGTGLAKLLHLPGIYSPTPLPETPSTAFEGSSKWTTKAAEELETGFTHSPFPLTDSFITSKLTKGGVQGSIRRWTYFPKGKIVLYDIQHNRWCENVGRAHKSNNIMMVADLKQGTYYQKCHDPDCRRINFRSNEIPIPLECNPVLLQLEEERKQASSRADLEEGNCYIGNVSLEDIEEFEDSALASELEDERRKSLLSVEATGTELYDGGISVDDIEEFEDSCSTRVLNEASSRAKLELSKHHAGHRKHSEDTYLTKQLEHENKHMENVGKQASYGAQQVEANPYVEGISLQDIQQFEEATSSSDDVRECIGLLSGGDDALDVVLREALEDYESHLSPNGD